MADFEKVVKKFTNDEGNIVADSIGNMVNAIAKYVGEGFVTVDRYNSKKAQVEELQSKLEESEKQSDEYAKLKKDFEAYKTETESKAAREEKETAYKAILGELGIPEKRYGAILKTVDFDGLEMEGGNFKDAGEIKKQAKEEWGDFIVTAKETGVPSQNPPANNGGKATMTKAEIMAIKDSVARQKAIVENAELFGISKE